MLETVMFINPENNLGLVLFSAYMILEAFGLQCLSWFVSPIFSLSVLATVSDACLSSTGALAVLCGVSGSGSDVAVGCLVCMFLGDLFPVGFGRLHSFHVIFGGANVTSEKVLV